MAQPALIAQLLESTADAAFAVDARGIVRIWNTAASTLFGWRDADIIGLARRRAAKHVASTARQAPGSDPVI